MTGRYVLMTPARNEAAYIERTLMSVVNQDLKPLRWVIVDDNSDDDTAAIVADYARRHPFIELVTTAGDRTRNFGSKAKVLQEAYSRLVDLDFDFVGNLDADVSFGTAYYREMLARFDADPQLGIVGGIQYDWIDGRWQLLHQSSNSVAGPFQLFRRRCWEDVGGYRVLPYGGVDAAAEVTARQLGWRVRSHPEQVVYHHRATGTAVDGYHRARFRAGQRDFTLGYHPLFLAFRAGGETLRGSLREFLGGGVFLLGYLWAQLRRPVSGVPEPVVQFLRAEQMQRLRTMVRERRDPVPRHRTLPSSVAPAPYGQDRTTLRLLVILGAGGHTTEVLNLVDLLGDGYDYEYLVGKSDPLSAEQIRRPGPVHTVHYPRSKTSSDAATAVGLLYNGLQSIGVLLRHRPDAVLSTGPSVAVATLFLAKLLRIRVIFVETGSRIRTVSVTGRLAYKIADLYFVQWPQLQETLPKAIYAGRLI